MAAPAPPPPFPATGLPDHGTTLRGAVDGRRGELLGLVLRTIGLTLVTGGLYSFWARTRVRRWIWGSVRMGGAPFEYRGEPLEKAMGFAIAAVLVAVWFGLVVMLLVWASINLTHAPEPGLVAAFAALLPVYWFAQYRGRRYLLSHTSWRGLSFDMAPGAWGYAWRAALWTALAVATLGLLVPLRRHRLFRFMADRASYGDGALRLDLSARRLWAPWLPALAGLWGSAAVAGAAAAADAPEALGWLALTAPLLFGGCVHWRVASLRLLLSGLRWGQGASLTAAPRTWQVVRIQLLGWLAVLAILAVLAPFASGIVAALAADGEAAAATLDLDLSGLEIAAGVLVFYVLFFVLRGGLHTALVTWPLLGHVVGTTRVDGAPALDGVRAAPPARMADADGFANLFDMGAGI